MTQATTFSFNPQMSTLNALFQLPLGWAAHYKKMENVWSCTSFIILLESTHVWVYVLVCVCM